VHDNTYTTWEKRSAYFTQLLEKVGSMPEVTLAGISSNATPPDNGWDNQFEILGRPMLDQQQARLNLVSPEYFSVLQISLVQGRIWDKAEGTRGARVAVVNQTLASKYWPGGDAVGHQIRFPRLKAEPPIVVAIPESNDWMEIVGVIADVRDDGLGKPVKPGAYIPFTIIMQPWTQILVRSQVPPLSILHGVRQQIHTVDADQQAAGHVRSLEDWIRQQREWAQHHLVSLMFGAFAAIALVLAAVGLYSVVSYSVAQRTNEFGIRIALGAMPGDVLRMVFASTTLCVGAGVVAGLLLSLGFNRLVSRWVEHSSINAMILLGVTLLMSGVAAIACLIPALRASSVDPMKALRYE
jgi:predicted permease